MQLNHYALVHCSAAYGIQVHALRLLGTPGNADRRALADKFGLPKCDDEKIDLYPLANVSPAYDEHGKHIDEPLARVCIEVRGGVADYRTKGSVDVEMVDYDDNPDAEPEHRYDDDDFMDEDADPSQLQKWADLGSPILGPKP